MRKFKSKTAGDPLPRIFDVLNLRWEEKLSSSWRTLQQPILWGLTCLSSSCSYTMNIKLQINILVNTQERPWKHPIKKTHATVDFIQFTILHVWPPTPQVQQSYYWIVSLAQNNCVLTNSRSISSTMSLLPTWHGCAFQKQLLVVVSRKTQSCFTFHPIRTQPEVPTTIRQQVSL